jgi:hypothetical protein
MKIKRFNENIDESNLRSQIADIISYGLEMRPVPYSRIDNDWEIDPESIDKVAAEVIEYLKLNANLQVGLDSKKYNL